MQRKLGVMGWNEHRYPGQEWSPANPAFKACGLDFMPPVALSCLW